MLYNISIYELQLKQNMKEVELLNRVQLLYEMKALPLPQSSNTFPLFNVPLIL